jgi:hypothetical protein
MAMALIVENGTIVPNADSYDTLANLSAAATLLGMSLPATGSAEVIAAAEAAARRATYWLDANYRGEFIGYRKLGRNQPREWPRSSAYSTEPPYNSILDTEIPYELKQAQAIVAVQEYASPSSMTPVVTPSQAIKSVSIEGAISVDFATPSGVQSQIPVLTALDGVLGPILKDASSSEYSNPLVGTSERSS